MTPLPKPYHKPPVPQFVAPLRTPTTFKDQMRTGASITAIVYEMPFTVPANPYDAKPHRAWQQPPEYMDDLAELTANMHRDFENQNEWENGR